MEENLNQARKSSPAEVSIRTMDLDVKALEQGGGEITAPQAFVPETKFQIPGYLGPEKSMFGPAKEFSKSQIESASSFKWLKIVGIVILVAALVAGFGYFAYFAVSHWIFPAQMPAV